MHSIAAWLDQWGSLALTGILVGVTAWYAALTKSIASASRDAADQARDAAKNSADAAAIMAAGAGVAFHLSPTYGPVSGAATVNDPLVFDGLRLTCTGSAVFVHALQIAEAWQRVDSFEGKTGEFRIRATTNTLHPEPRVGDGIVEEEIFRQDQLPFPVTAHNQPTLLHKDEWIMPDLPQQVRALSVEAVTSLVVNVAYSFARESELRWRSVEYVPQEAN